MTDGQGTGPGDEQSPGLPPLRGFFEERLRDALAAVGSVAASGSALPAEGDARAVPVERNTVYLSMHWKTALDYGLLREADLTDEQRREVEEDRLRYESWRSERDAAEAQCVAHGGHDWRMVLSDGGVDVTCGRCPAEVEDVSALLGEVPVRIMEEHDAAGMDAPQWKVYPREA